MQDAHMLYTSCVSTVIQKPAYEQLLPHLQNLDTGRHTAAQLTDETFPSQSDAALFAARFNELNECRAQYLAAISPARPDLVPIVVDTYSRGDEISALLVQRRITWAEAARRSEAVTADMREKATTAEHVWVAELRSEHQAEVAQSQAAAAALARWAKARRMLDGVMHPVITGGR